jgi:hypothetical protein
MRHRTFAALVGLTLPASIVQACARGSIEAGHDVGWADDASGTDGAGPDVGAMATDDGTASETGSGSGDDGAPGPGSDVVSAGDSPQGGAEASVCAGVADGVSCGSSSVCESGTCQPCGGTGEYCCTASACDTSPARCIAGNASKCHSTITPQCVCGKLIQQLELKTAEQVWSCDGRFVLAMQTDGNLVLYEGSTALWASHTAGSGATVAVMQDDGNFVLYTTAGKAVWATGTGGAGCETYLAVQNDGNVVVYDSAGKAIFATNTCCH